MRSTRHGNLPCLTSSYAFPRPMPRACAAVGRSITAGRTSSSSRVNAFMCSPMTCSTNLGRTLLAWVGGEREPCTALMNLVGGIHLRRALDCHLPSPAKGLLRNTAAPGFLLPPDIRQMSTWASELVRGTRSAESAGVASRRADTDIYLARRHPGHRATGRLLRSR